MRINTDIIANYFPPKNNAVLFKDKKYSHVVLNNYSNQYANHLLKKGIKSGTLVGICLDRTIDMIAAVLGVLKTGAAYIPLDPGFPKARLNYMVDNSRLDAVITQNEYQSIFGTFNNSKTPDKELNYQLILIDHEKEKIEKEPTTAPEVTIDPESLAYVIYTSGSTGNPKGVQIQHKALINFLLSMQKTPGITKDDRVLAITTLSFDISGLELFLPLITGATIVLASSETAKDANKLIQYIEDNNVTVMQATPATYQMLLESGWENKTVRKILCGGEALSIDLANKLQDQCSEVWNMYGPTETTIWSSVYRLQEKDKKPLIGKPIDNTVMVLLDENQKPVPVKEGMGELYIGGIGLSKGYLHRDDLTAERFIPCPPEWELNTEVLYKTGDICRYAEDGNFEYIERADFQVKLRGFRIELGEIENTLLKYDTVSNCVVTVREDVPGVKKLVAYLIEKEEGTFSSSKARIQLRESLPEYMVPENFITLKRFPLTPNNKVDRKALPKPGKDRPELSTRFIQPTTEMEKLFAGIWSQLLEIDTIGVDDNFFDLGGNSLLGLRVINILRNNHNIQFPIVKLFEYPTITQLTDYLENKDQGISTVDEVNSRATYQRIGRFTNDPMTDGVAIVGMAGKFPGADNLDQLWENLCEGKESITRFSKAELGPGIDEELLNDPDYIPARGILNDADKFDAAFFGISPAEAKVMDPQHRVFLELSYQALENAGYDPDTFAGLIGMYAGAGDNYYHLNNVIHAKSLTNMVGRTVVGYGNFKDYIATRASYHLNLTGPGISMNTGCSTTLLTVDAAFQGLINYDCDMALAGGIDIYVPQKSGFLYQLNGTFSKDGHCRPFDADASGTMFCDGAGIVVLKRLKDAVRDRDKIYSVIRGSAKNNDGGNKASFLSPSSEGQSRVIAMAQAMANVSPDDIGYIEAHGTGTPIGDPIEFEGLMKAFNLFTSRKQFCYLGSVKGNIGHPTNAAGVAGIIKASLSLHNEQIPGTMHFRNINPKIDIDNSPFIVTSELTDWERGEKPRLAGVSSFGFGGTNVHVVLEEAPQIEQSLDSPRPYQLMLLSGKSKSSLDQLTSDFSTFMQSSRPVPADAAYTLMTGRKNHGHRRFVLGKSPDHISENSVTLYPNFSGYIYCDVKNREVCFMFPGQGSQYVGMGRNLYETEPVFRQTVNECAAVINQWLKRDILDILRIKADTENGTYDEDDEFDSLQNTYYTQPAIFIIEYSLAKLLMSWGVVPSVMVGHSIGEFVCATLSGIFKLEDALRLIALRGKLISDLPHGSMLSVRKNLDEVRPLLPDTIQPAADNSPNLCVVAGPDEEILAFQKTLEAAGIASKKLHTSHAFHSAMMDPAVDALINEVKEFELGTPSIPFLSTLNNQWVTVDSPTEPEYWGRHMRQAVLFSGSIQKLLDEKKYLFLELGPRATLATLTRQHSGAAESPAVSVLSDTWEDSEEHRALHYALGYLWMNGVEVDWKAYFAHEVRYKTPLPLYPFERTRYWIDPPSVKPQVTEAVESVGTVEVDISVDDTRADTLMLSLTGMISEVFGQDISSYGEDTTFIEMGMDSLFLTQVAYKILEQFKVKVSFGHLLKDYPNLRMLADHIRKNILSNSSSSSPVKAPPAQTLSKRDENGYEIIPEQASLWRRTKAGDASRKSLNDSFTLKLSGSINKEYLKKAISLLTQKHDALRSRFDESGSRIQIDREIEADVEELDVASLSKNEKEAALRALYSRLLSDYLDPVSVPLFRTALVQTDADSLILVFVCSSLILDRWAMDVLISHLISFYSDLESGRVVSTESDFSYADYLREKAEQNRTSDSTAEEYWQEEIRRYGASRLELGTKSPASADNAENALRMCVSLNSTELQGLKTLARKRNVSLFTVMLSLYGAALGRHTGKSEIGMGHILADQSLLNHADLVGCCSGTFPITLNVDGDLAFSALLSDTQSTLADHFSYGDFHLYSDADGGFDWAGAVRINHTKLYGADDIHNSQFGVSYFFTPLVYTGAALSLDIMESESSIDLVCTGDSDRVDRQFIRNVLASMLTIIGNLIESGDSPVRELLSGKTAPEQVENIDLNGFIRNLILSQESQYPAKSGSGAGEAVTAGEILPAPEGPLILSASQKRLWFFHMVAPESPAYNLALKLKISGRVDYSAVQQSIEYLVNRHQVFRTVFKRTEREPEAVVLTKVETTCTIVDLGTDDNPKAVLGEKIKEGAARPFNLEEAPLFRFVLYVMNLGEAELVLYIPHILIDGWSFNVVYREFEEVYGALLESKTPDLPVLDVHYTDYAFWEKAQQNDASRKEQIEYWTGYLGSDVPVLQLPHDRPRPLELSVKGSTSFFSVPEDLSRRLKAFGKSRNVSLFLLVFSAVHILMHKYSQQQKVIIGTPYANKDFHQLENVIGFFLKMLPIKSEFKEGLSIRDLIDSIRDGFYGALTHSDVQLEEIISALKLEREMNINPIFQVMFTYQNYLKPRNDGTSFTVFQEFSERGLTEYDLSFYLWETESGIDGALEYSTDLFNTDTIQRIVSHFTRILEVVAENNAIRVSDISLLTPAEHTLMIDTWNSTARDYSGHTTFLELFDEAGKSAADSTAVICNDRSISYKELNLLSGRIGGYLSGKGVGRGAKVGICLDRSINMIAAVLGVLKTGAAYIPLDPSFPRERLNYMIESSQLSCIISDKHLLDHFNAPESTEILQLESVLAALDDRPWEQPEIGPDDLAYVIYTSGSTGKPKGVKIHHKALLNFLLAMRNKPGIEASDRMLALTTLSFDISCLELYLPLICGATVVLADSDMSKDIQRLPGYMEDHKVSVMQATPAMYKLLLDGGWVPGKGAKLLCGGEAMSRDLAQALVSASDEVWNMYGPTETTVWSSVSRVEGGDRAPLIGRPVDNTTMYILDSSLNPVPIGVSGELYIGGDGVSRGYLNRDDLTSERFISDPFSSNPEALMYKTGDVCRYHGDGNIEYIGRSDFQVKLRGYRIELGEIEAVVKEHPAVVNAVVILGRDVEQNPRLECFLTGSELPEESELRSMLSGKLPLYMIPDLFIAIEELPLTPNRKVDRNALSALEYRREVKREERTSEIVHAERDIEKKLLEIWRGVLNLETISMTDNFFDLGGNSLLVIQVQQQIRQNLDIDVPVARLFQHTRLKSLADYLNPETADTAKESDAQMRSIRKKQALENRKNRQTSRRK